MTNTATQLTPKETLMAAIEKHGLKIKAEFVPFSRSRNKAEKTPSLNWRVTLGREVNRVDGYPIYQAILTTDYSAGCGHCPSYSQREIADSRSRVAQECETGRSHKSRTAAYSGTAPRILPDTADFLYSLIVDAGVLDHSSFEDWASDFGYEADSRKAEAIYRQCLEIALKLRAGLGDTVLADLREAAQDY